MEGTHAGINAAKYKIHSLQVAVWVFIAEAPNSNQKQVQR